MLTERQERMIKFIADFTREKGYPPTISEIGEGCEISSSSVVSKNRDRLAEENLITITPNTARGIILTEKGRELLRGAE